MLKSFFWGFFIIFIGLLSWRVMTWIPNPYPLKALPDHEVPVFNMLGVNFAHQYDKNHALPFMGGAVFDMKGDGQNYLFLSGGYDQPDRIYKYNHDSLIDITEESGITKDALDTTYGVAAIDAHNHGLIDLFIARESGVYLYKNVNGKYEGKKLDIPLDPKHAPLSIAVADLKKRGKVDLFICTHLKAEHLDGPFTLQHSKGAKSLLLLNNGDNTFTDITKEAGLEIDHNALQAAFVDLDDDGEMDLVVIYENGPIATYRNMGNLKFKSMPNPSSHIISSPKSIAIGDYNNDGRPDLFISNLGPFHWWNVGATPPNIMALGDLSSKEELHRSQMLWRNEGNFQFTDVAKQAHLADYELSRGAVFADFNNNGYLDLALTQNDIWFPPHKVLRLPSRLLLQQKDNTFASTEKEADVENPYYGISPLIVDLTNNGYPDLIYLNLNGPTRVFLNRGNGNNYIKVTLKNEPRSLGAKVTVKIKSGKILTGFFIPTQGLCSYQTNSLFFGLGQEKEVESVHIKYTDGTHQHYDHPPANRDLRVKA